MKITITFVFLLSLTTFIEAQWIECVPIPQSNDLYSIKLISPNIGLAVGNNGTIIKTTNGGTNWIIQNSGTIISLYSTYFINDKVGTVVCDSGIILRTTDGGILWIKQSSGTNYGLYDVFFSDINIGIAVAAVDTILRTINGGTSWSAQYCGTTSPFNLTAVYFMDSNKGLAIGSVYLNRTGILSKAFPWTSIYRTTNSGETWNPSILEAGYGAMSFSDAKNSTFVGGGQNDNGYVYPLICRTTSGGDTIFSQQSPVNDVFKGVPFTDANIGTVVGYYGNIIRTTDGGNTWISQLCMPGAHLMDVSFNDANHGIAVGLGGLVLTTTNGGITFIGNDPNTIVPIVFPLSQNYPNPFNPSTTINYSNAKMGNTKISVYNAIGSKVATIVDEYRPVGNFSVQFNAGNLPSGVYFYKLESGGYVETKKLLLMK